MICGEIQQEASELLGGGMRETKGAHFCDRRMIGFTELLRHSQSCLAVLPQEVEKIIPGDEIGLSRFDYVGRKLIGFPCDRRWQAKNFSRF